MLQLQVFAFNPLQENTYILFDETRECVIIDPGCYDAEEKYELTSFIEHHQLTVKMLLNTHCHVDHVLGNAFVKEKYKVKLFIHEKDEPVLKAVKVYAPHYGFFQYDEATADAYLQEDDYVHFGNQKLKILFTPGHAPGHVVFYHEGQKIVIGGDVLFYNSIGRTDLPGGDFSTLIESIHTKLFTLPDDVTVYPGHGPETTIEFEKQTNPFCAIKH
ncbi:MBL fold metallo-hydrolase [Pseudochryseolinea flava]|uniref:MBL fold metallo-hydrolase n=1 Tax=Pseudochryseolinea flava TaxID=2059302 RepID=A0A364YCI7_9BACT|nr:MBL fold metallo-hydrolase [Pseudochryseolinea flava]RAW03408.1 MBL fold metallo-hydrolase [Pseudochryseolinea flava]